MVFKTILMIDHKIQFGTDSKSFVKLSLIYPHTSFTWSLGKGSRWSSPLEPFVQKNKFCAIFFNLPKISWCSEKGPGLTFLLPTKHFERFAA